MPGRRVWRSLIAARHPAAGGEPRWLRVLKTLRATMVETAAVLIGVLLVVLLVWEATRERVVIEPLFVPKELAEAGFTGEVIAQRMIAEIREIQAGAQTTMERRDVGYASLDLEVPIAVAGSQISPRALAAYLRHVTCALSSWACRPQLRFGGDVTRHADGFRIETRVSGGEKLVLPGDDEKPPVAIKDIDQLVKRGAETVIWRTDPYILASYTYNYDRQKAEQLSRMILREQPVGSAAGLRAINLIGLIRHDSDDLAGAEAQYRHAIEIDPDFAVAHMNLGNIQQRRGEFDDAIASHQRAIASDPRYARAHANLGLAHYSKGENGPAVASYRRALELDPRLAIVHSNLCVALKNTDLPHAIIACRRALDLDPDYAAGHFNLGLALAQKGDFDGAIAAYRRAIDLSPEHSHVRDAAASALVGLTGPRG